jgi:hypothetical protein
MLNGRNAGCAVMARTHLDALGLERRAPFKRLVSDEDARTAAH